MHDGLNFLQFFSTLISQDSLCQKLGTYVSELFVKVGPKLLYWFHLSGHGAYLSNKLIRHKREQSYHM